MCMPGLKMPPKKNRNFAITKGDQTVTNGEIWFMIKPRIQVQSDPPNPPLGTPAILYVHHPDHPPPPRTT